MADQIVITEKSSQAKDVRAAVGSRYGEILPAEGHLLDLLEPEDVVPAWKRWSPILLRPEGLYGTRPAEGGNKAAKLRAIREALRTARRVWLATDCDREGQLIGQEILEHCEYRGQVLRVLFTAQDSQTIREAFGRAKPNSEYARLYAAAVARRQADQIYNLSLTRTATVILRQGARRVIGVGRVKTPTLAIVCKRELEIRNFVPVAYFEVVATAKVAGGQFQMRHAPQNRIVRREIAQEIADAARGFEGALIVRVEDKRQGPPKLHDLPSLQKLCGSRFGWPASKTLEVAQELYDGQGKKIITYPRAEVRYLPQSLIADRGRTAGGTVVQRNPRTRAASDPQGCERHFLRQGAGGREPSRRYPQRQYDRQIAGGLASVVIPEEAKANSAAMSAWIDSNRGTKRRKHGRKTAYKLAGSVGRQSTATTKRSRKRKADAAAVPPAPAQPNSVTGTPLRIPYGNKEVALKLGARYRSGGWYAPPGVDLSAFGERGWL
jgi:DNA topoisomerase-3